MITGLNSRMLIHHCILLPLYLVLFLQAMLIYTWEINLLILFPVIMIITILTLYKILKKFRLRSNICKVSVHLKYLIVISKTLEWAYLQNNKRLISIGNYYDTEICAMSRQVLHNKKHVCTLWKRYVPLPSGDLSFPIWEVCVLLISALLEP